MLFSLKSFLISLSNLKKKNRRAFSLIETAIVIIIISLIILGVLATQSLVNSSKVRSIIAEMREINVMTNAFRAKYNYFPGDFPNARLTFGDVDSEGNVVADGDGNSLVGSDSPFNLESLGYFHHLYLSGILEGKYTGQMPNPQEYQNITKEHYMFSKASSNMFFYVYSSAGFLYSDSNRIGIKSNLSDGGAMPGDVAYMYDLKVDDGMPLTGNVVVNTVDISGVNLLFKQDNKSMFVENNTLSFSLIKEAYAASEGCFTGQTRSVSDLESAVYTKDKGVSCDLIESFTGESNQINPDLPDQPDGSCNTTGLNELYMVKGWSDEGIIGQGSTIRSTGGCIDGYKYMYKEEGDTIIKLECMCEDGGTTCDSGVFTLVSDVACVEALTCPSEEIALELNINEKIWPATEAGETVTLNCSSGYETDSTANSTITRVCGADGVWQEADFVGCYEPGEMTFTYENDANRLVNLAYLGIPDFVNSVETVIRAWGAQGGSSLLQEGYRVGGHGAFVYSKLEAFHGHNIQLHIGEKGKNASCNNGVDIAGSEGQNYYESYKGLSGHDDDVNFNDAGGAGGGATAILLNGEEIIVAAGGGGAYWTATGAAGCGLETSDLCNGVSVAGTDSACGGGNDNSNCTTVSGDLNLGAGGGGAGKLSGGVVANSSGGGGLSFVSANLTDNGSTKGVKAGDGLVKICWGSGCVVSDGAGHSSSSVSDYGNVCLSCPQETISVDKNINGNQWNATLIGNTATLTCKDGYGLYGGTTSGSNVSIMRTCDTNGNWSSYDSCVKAECASRTVGIAPEGDEYRDATIIGLPLGQMIYICVTDMDWGGINDCDAEIGSFYCDKIGDPAQYTNHSQSDRGSMCDCNFSQGDFDVGEEQAAYWWTSASNKVRRKDWTYTWGEPDNWPDWCHYSEWTCP